MPQIPLKSEHLPTVPAYAPDDVHFVGQAVVGRVARVVRNDLNARRIAHRDVLQALGHQPEAIVEHKDPGRLGNFLGHVYQHRVAILEGWLQLRRDGWRSGILAISVSDQRLTTMEREAILAIGERLYGGGRGKGA